MKFSIKHSLLLITAICIINRTYGENILFFWGVSGMSHQISAWPLVEKLVERGHNVTFLSPFQPKKPNPKVHEITKPTLLSAIGLDFDLLNKRISEGFAGISGFWSTYFDFGIKVCDTLLKDPDLVNWVHSSSYDLVIINGMFNDCAYGLTYKFNAPHIMYGTTTPWFWWPEAYGYFDENYPEFQYSYPLDMNFFQSVNNALRPFYWHLNRHLYMFPRIEAILRERLNMPDMPSLAEMEKNPSLVFINIHFTEEYARSLPPLFVEVGGMHCTDDIKPLPKEYLDFIESGEEGFIYFSLGTFTKPEDLPSSLKNTFFNAMAKFHKTKFLVKWDDESIEGVAKNIKKVRWTSQQDVLAHPKIRAFISHGGLLGTQEAIYHGVPMIVLPLFADQDCNADRIERRGRGIRLEISELTEQILISAIAEIINNNTYIENTKKLSKLFKDRPSKPVDTALWWTEYVLRNKDTSHLRPIGMKRTWYQRRMLHIWGFLTALVITLVSILGLFAYFLAKIIFNTPKTRKEKVSKKTKKVQ